MPNTEKEVPDKILVTNDIIENGTLPVMKANDSDQAETVNGQLRIKLQTKNKRIKKLGEALVAARAWMHAFTQGSEAMTINNNQLIFQNQEKEKLAAELVIAKRLSE